MPLSAVTVDSRTIKTNYNVADNSTGAHELWLRGGFELRAQADDVKNQVYVTTAPSGTGSTARPTRSSPSTSTIDRDRFFVTHKQQVIGNNTDLIWNRSFFGMENRLAAQLQVSRNDITFRRGRKSERFPFDTRVRGQSRPGLYGLMPQPDIRNSRSTPSLDRSRIG